MKIAKDTYLDLREDQKQGVTFLAKARSALLADGVGTGKTAQAIHGCQEVGARTVLVVCTASIKYNWKKEGVKWGYHARDIHILDNENVKALPEIGMFVINYDLCWRKNYAKVLLKRDYDVLICDEAHYLKNHKAKRARAVWLSKGYADRATHRWMMTATPVLNRPVELHAMLKKLCPERLGQFTNYIAYTQRYCEGHDGKWGYDATGAANLDELSGRLDGFMLRRTRDEVMPDKTLQKIYMPFTKDVERHLFKGTETDSIRRKIGCGKIKPAAEHIRNILDSGEKVVAFAYHTDVILGLEKELSDFSPVVLRGATPGHKRQAAIDRFQEDDKCRLFIGQIEAAGVGIDGLQHAASIAVFVETNCPPGTIKQAIGRVFREGQKRPCLFQFLLVEGTIDEQVLDKTVFKDENIKVIMKDEKTELDFSKKEVREMSMEGDIKRIADALEAFVKHSMGVPTAAPPAPPAPAAPAAPGPFPADAPKKAAGRKKKAVAPALPVEKKVSPTPPNVNTYQAKMHGVANRISAHAGDPAKTNALFAKLQGEFKIAYPDRANVFDIPESEYANVTILVDKFLEKEKIK